MEKSVVGVKKPYAKDKLESRSTDALVLVKPNCTFTFLAKCFESTSEASHFPPVHQ